MNLPDLRYECVHCGYSCQGLEVQLSSHEHDQLSSEHPGAVAERDGRFWLRKEACGACHFLMTSEGEGRCRLHRDQGAEAKPVPCREFPFRAMETPGGVFVGASFACRAIAQRLGPSLNNQEISVRTLAWTEVPLAPQLPMDWPRYLRWEALVGQQLLLGPQGLWSAALEISLEVLQTPPRPPSASMEADLQAAFRGLMALAEGPMDQPTLLAFLQAHAEQGSYVSRILAAPVDIGAVMQRWEEPWSLWPEVVPFFQHLLFRKYLLEGPDVHSRICSLPILAQILEFLVLAKTPSGADREDVFWALRVLEERLTFHARGLDGYLGRCGRAFLEGLSE